MARDRGRRGIPNAMTRGIEVPTYIKRYSRVVLRKVPVVGGYLRKRAERGRFRVELDLIKGTHRNENKHPSIIHFSLHKAATQYTKSILRRCASENGMTPVFLPDYGFNTKFPYLDLLSAAEMEKYQHIFKPAGYLYSVFGGMIEGVPELEQYILVFLVRDPRDLLVSEYYSLAYSHGVPDKRGDKYEQFLKLRRAAQSMTIDDHVVARCENTYEVLHRYKTLLMDRYPKVHITRYEDMTADFRSWLRDLLDSCRLEISRELLQSLLEESERLRPKEEDIRRHIRKGRPGDYKEKLRAETIDYLNGRLSPMLEVFGYQ